MNLTRLADMEMGTPPEEADRVMHVSFLLADGQILMGSDRLASMGQVTAGDSVHVMLGPDTVEEGERLFAVLSDGGTVSMPIGPVPWDAHYGAFVDRFGISWMLDVEHH
jgi:PhnB protein